MHSLFVIATSRAAALRVRAIVGRDRAFRDVDQLSDHMLRDIGLVRNAGDGTPGRF